MYITSILLEDFTLPDLRSVSAFKTQHMVTRLFHGPVSHILIYSGWMAVFLMLAIMDMYIKLPILNGNYLSLFVVGGITGLFYALGQIYNGTAIYQFVANTVVILLTTSFLSINRTNLLVIPIASYYVGLIWIFEFVVGSHLFYLLLCKKKGQHITWDRSGGPGEISPDEKLLDRLFKS